VAPAQTAAEQYKPTVGMAGKDAVWVPTSDAMVEKMLDLARVTAKDVVMDLGSGDGRMIIAAARRGARAIGVEFNPDLVKLSAAAAAKAGVSDKASFVQGDMFAADISKATVLSLFLLPEHFAKLTPKFLALPPGSRIVVNTFGIPDWEPDVVERLESGCETWCEAKLYIVPANVEGTWQIDGGTLALQQTFQRLTGTLTSDGQARPIARAALQGDRIQFAAGDRQYDGRVSGNTIEGTVKTGTETATFTARRPSR
jgi:SAM-dependent methyltransferase